jgi:hypothetical protein
MGEEVHAATIRSRGRGCWSSSDRAMSRTSLRAAVAALNYCDVMNMANLPPLAPPRNIRTNITRVCNALEWQGISNAFHVRARRRVGVAVRFCNCCAGFGKSPWRCSCERREHTGRGDGDRAPAGGKRAGYPRRYLSNQWRDAR